jgi:glycosyltransferase involved in cell wall biosynthesis
MLNSPYISICIPAYKRLDFLKRLLNSISIQNFRPFEVIITDDSPDDIIASYVRNEKFSFPVRYYKNSSPKGTPLNWMEGIQYAKGEWIKIIHDDDWLTDANSLQYFADAASENTDCVFCGYHAYFENTRKSINKTISQKEFQRIYKHPYYLFASNDLGPPSVVMFRKSVNELYDPALKWLVDIEGYVRMMQKYRCVYIDKALITMSYNDTQVTNECFRNPAIEIREALFYYQKNGSICHRRMVCYDAWWRLLRNLGIRSLPEIKVYAGDLAVPLFLQDIVSLQRRIPLNLLKIGLISKLFMFLTYSLNYIRGFRRYH